LPAGSTIILRATDDSELGEIEWSQSHLIVWASASRVEVFIDGVLQESASAIFSLPGGLTKETLGIIFADQPATRLGGAHTDVEKRMSFWGRVKNRLHF
jgi:hypothetical protein